MKLLQNPIVVGVLAVGAVGVVFYQFGGAKLFQGRVKVSLPAVTMSVSSQPSPAAAPQPAAVTATASKAGNAGDVVNREAARPAKAVDAGFVETEFPKWVKAPLRDPFLLLAPEVETVSQVDTNSPVPTWTLKAIWNQTGSRLAVINNRVNNRVYRVGDEVSTGYSVLRIESDEVWFKGPVRTERLGFPDKTRTNAPAALPAGTRRT